eukprot:3704790-Prymnesium_polylepis.1
MVGRGARHGVGLACAAGSLSRARRRHVVGCRVVSSLACAMWAVRCLGSALGSGAERALYQFVLRVYRDASLVS